MTTKQPDTPETHQAQTGCPCVGCQMMRRITAHYVDAGFLELQMEDDGVAMRLTEAGKSDEETLSFMDLIFRAERQHHLQRMAETILAQFASPPAPAVPTTRRYDGKAES